MKDNRVKVVIAINVLLIIGIAGIIVSGCRQSERVSYNISVQADSFNTVRQITVINCIKGDVIFQMTGKMSITADVEDHQLEVIVEDEN